MAFQAELATFLSVTFCSMKHKQDELDNRERERERKKLTVLQRHKVFYEVFYDVESFYLNDLILGFMRCDWRLSDPHLQLHFFCESFVKL